MIFTETKLQGAFIIDLQKHVDERGFFARTWCHNEFAMHGLKATPVQCNMSFNAKRGTLRGLHYQVAPYEEAKLIRCTKGAIFDVIVDLRPDSVTYMQWLGIELSDANRQMLFVSEGFAHGFQTLQDDSEVFYQVSQSHQPDAERGVRWNDPAFGIEWPEDIPCIMSVRDQRWPDYTPSPIVGSR